MGFTLMRLPHHAQEQLGAAVQAWISDVEDCNLARCKRLECRPVEVMIQMCCLWQMKKAGSVAQLAGTC